MVRLQAGKPRLVVITIPLFRGLISLAVLFGLLFGWLWYQNVYLNPERVFWDMVDNNLATTSLVRSTSKTNGNQKIDTLTRMLFGQQNLTDTIEKTSLIKTPNYYAVQEKIGLSNADYIRYLSIHSNRKTSSGQPVNYSTVQGVWGITSNSFMKPQFFKNSIIGTFPAANLDHYPRNELVKFIRQNNIFTVNFNNVMSFKVNGRNSLVYNVKINPRPYFIMYRQFVHLLGIDPDFLPNPDNFANFLPLEVKVYISPTSRQLLRIHYNKENRDEDYSGYGLNESVELPSQTIPTIDLQRRIQTLQSR